MGDTKKQRKKYRGPSHPWQKLRIEEEQHVLKAYGLKNKTEIWRMASQLKNFAHQAKKLNPLATKEAEKERQQLLQKLIKLGLLQHTAKLDDVLSLSLKDILERRLQTQVVRRGLAKSMREARQLITHKHIMVKGQKITAPSYLVAIQEQEALAFAGNSPFSNPERRKSSGFPSPETEASEHSKRAAQPKPEIKRVEAAAE